MPRSGSEVWGMPVKGRHVIAGLVVLVAVVMAVTGHGDLATMLMLAALGISVIIPW